MFSLAALFVSGRNGGMGMEDDDSPILANVRQVTSTRRPAAPCPSPINLRSEMSLAAVVSIAEVDTCMLAQVGVPVSFRAALFGATGPAVEPCTGTSTADNTCSLCTHYGDVDITRSPPLLIIASNSCVWDKHKIPQTQEKTTVLMIWDSNVSQVPWHVRLAGAALSVSRGGGGIHRNDGNDGLTRWSRWCEKGTE